MGVMKSRKLDRVRLFTSAHYVQPPQVRQQIRRQNANTEQMFNSYARSNYQEGMTADEFNLLSGTTPAPPQEW